MAERLRKEFCTECRKRTEYLLQTENVVKKIREKEYTFKITVAHCLNCGASMSIPGLIDKNVKEIDEQYRKIEGIATISDIENLTKLYNIGKEPLSIVLGFGLVTIPRYMSGQVPSKEYSDIIKSALASPEYMKKCLIKNREKVSAAAYNKAISKVNGLNDIFNSISRKMIAVIAYIFDKLEEVTPLMLQKLLYFIQGLSYVKLGKPMFNEDCEAWAHGPVYPRVYHLFRDFKYNPIDDPRFAILKETMLDLDEGDIEVIDLVLNTYGIYGGKVLEKITHNEEPWKEAFVEYGDGIHYNIVLSKERIKEYYDKINRSYNISTEEGLNKYIGDVLAKVS